MRKIISINYIEKRKKDGKVYYRTHMTLDSGEEATAYGKDFAINDLVEVFFDDKWDTVKARKTLK